MMNYEQTLDYLYSQLPMFQRTGPAAYKNTLENTLLLDALFGHPHHSFRTIHVGGTNGKGSSSHMLASVLQQAGYSVGLYTSPHLVDFRERIRVNGQMMETGAVVAFVEKYLHLTDGRPIEPSFFELTVAMAFDYFKKCKVDVAVIEVGLGGRLDSTNIIHPEVSLITNISLDHTNLLGGTIAAIAHEKAGIIKSGTPVVIGETHEESAPVFSQKANETDAPVFFADKRFEAAYSTQSTNGKQLFQFRRNGSLAYPNLAVDLLGNYQKMNVAAVLQTIDLLRDKGWKITDRAIYEGLANTVKNTGLRGRWEIVGHNPLMVCDTGHNEAGIVQVVTQIRQTAWKNLHMVIGLVNDKDPAAVLALLPKEGTYYFTQAQLPRALPAADLEIIAKKAGLQGVCYSSVKEAVACAQKNAAANDLIFIGGSTFIVADFFS